MICLVLFCEMQYQNKTNTILILIGLERTCFKSGLAEGQTMLLAPKLFWHYVNRLLINYLLLYGLLM